MNTRTSAGGSTSRQPSMPPLLGLLQQCVGWTASIHVQATPVCLECRGSSFSYLAVRVCQFPWQRSCTGSDFHIESRTSCVSWSTKVCMDWHPTTCPDDVFEFETFLAMHISGRLQLDSSWCQLQTKRRLETKGSHTVALWHGTIFLCICGAMTAPHHCWTVSKNT